MGGQLDRLNHERTIMTNDTHEKVELKTWQENLAISLANNPDQIDFVGAMAEKDMDTARYYNRLATELLVAIERARSLIEERQV